jgi:hypothetical protein
LLLLGFKLFGTSLNYTRHNNMGLDAASLFNVNGMVAIITGGSSGIGATWAHALDQNGAAKVFILGRRENKLKEVAAAAVCIPSLGLLETHFSLTQNTTKPFPILPPGIIILYAEGHQFLRPFFNYIVYSVVNCSER